MIETVASGDILCFYEVINPAGGLAGMMVKETRERTIDNYVQWAQQQQIALPPGHSFYRAMWVKVSDSRLHKPFIPDKVPFQVNADQSIMLGEEKWWLDHIFTLYSDDNNELTENKTSRQESFDKPKDDVTSGDFFFEEE